MAIRLVTIHSTPGPEVRIPAAWLPELGLAEGDEAAAEVSPGRLVLADPRTLRRPRRPLAEIQAELAELAQTLGALRDRLAEVAGELPEPTEAMLRGEGPVDVAADVLGTLEILLHDDLDPALAKLRAAATISAEELRELWEQARPGAPTHP